ncbi:MAG: hypothetical protein MUQ25_16290 [Candidatus Aminicenantes bacterium]|nr:hypothetical protein [Candidatus Aminicenantes bacterium]
MPTVPSKFLVWPLVAYLPTSALTVGLLATIMRLGVVAPTGAKRFLDVFFAYALRFPKDFNIVRWVAPALGLAVLVLLSVAIRTARPIITMAQIRIFLLILIALLTILVKIFSVVVPLIPSGPGAGSSFGTAAPVSIYLFLFMDVDLCLVFLATFLPVYRGLRKRLV